MYLAAWRKKLPIVIHEANTRPGLANRVGARFSRHVAVAFPNTRLRNSRHVGMPMHKAVATLDRAAARAAARAALGLDADRPVLVVTGGSSGALSINRAIARSLDDLSEAGIQTLHITGRGKAVLDVDGGLLAADGYRQVEYVDGMENVYAAADVLLARAGAATVSEVAAVGLPAVFVPLPIGNGEQALNAAGLVRNGGALMVQDRTLSPDWIRSSLIPLLTDPGRLAEMSRKSESQGIRNADQLMADLVLEAVSD
jgi:UDP-N-acetylglucosamine--N-acetylmuramyl-(pentapeptide) pyrophosphoryl-undecaprenol N-acetylglucosamine transferase